VAYKKRKILDELYQTRLPSIYKREDAIQKPVPFPLKRYLGIAETGFDYIQDKLEAVYNLYDIDKCPPEFLDHLAQMVGFSFPYDMSDKERRAFLKALPTLYKNKGNRSLFNYLGRIMFGNNTQVSATRYNRTPERDYNMIELRVLVEENNTRDVNKQTDKYRAFAEKFRPVNHKLNVLISMFYADVFNRDLWQDNLPGQDLILRTTEEDPYDKSKMDYTETYKIWLNETDSYDVEIVEAHGDLFRDQDSDDYTVQPQDTEAITVLNHYESDAYDSSNIVDSHDKELLLNYENDSYNGISENLVLDTHLDTFSDADSDSYVASKSDSSIDKIIELGSFIGDTRPTGRLGKGFLLGRTNKEIVLAENTK
jgi:phage tail-like protein